MEQALVDYITAKNAETQEWVDAAEGRIQACYVGRRCILHVC